MLVGRSSECARIEALLEDARLGRSGVLVLRGEPGVGKSALLAYAAEQAGGLPVLRATGLESESELAFAGLHQLLRPALDRLDRLPPRQRAALLGAFGVTEGQGDDRFVVSLATLGLLAATAAGGGLLCVVDDAHWLDTPSADALRFAARRLHAEGVAILFAAAEGYAAEFDASELSELRVEGLSPSAASALLTRRAPGPLSPGVRDELVARSGGNPLALVELAGSLTSEQLGGREPLQEPLPVREHVERALLRRIRRLGEDARALLLLAAVDDVGDLVPVGQAAAATGIDMAALDELEASGLLRVEESLIEFNHPLVRSAIYRSTGSRQRRRAHLALAEVLSDEADADRRAWHRAAATAAPDEDIADELERTAVRARLRGGHAAAASALERAADLSPASADRGRRLADAAEANWLSGRPERAGALLEEAAGLVAEPVLRGRVAFLRGTVELARGAPGAAYRILVAEAPRVAAADPALALEMLVLAAEASWFAGRTEWAAELGRLAAETPHRGRDDERFMVALLVGTADVLQGDLERGAAILDEARALAETFDHPRYLIAAGLAAAHRGDDVLAYRSYARAVAELRAAGAIGELPHALALLSALDVWRGRFASAASNGFEGLRLGVETGHATSAGFQRAMIAHIHAVQGHVEECRAHAREALDGAAARGLRYQGAVALWALGRLDLGRERPGDALAHLAAIADPRAELHHPRVALFSAPDLVEAAVLCGDTAAARRALSAFERWTTSLWGRAQAARMRGLVAAGRDADGHFDEALALHEEQDLPFERARTRLAYGAHLRRTGRAERARELLRGALSVFDGIAAEQWAERTRAEIEAAGGTARPRPPSTIALLTPEELHTARFLAEGSTIEDVAASLFLSPTTVEYHLHAIFTKLGVTSRAALTRVLADGKPAAPAGRARGIAARA